jgi:hypothetical protein
MSPQERSILESLDAILQWDAVRAGIDPIVNQVARKLPQDRAALMAWEPIPLSIYGESLPVFIRSSWVFILRAWATTGAERHPNSHQRMMSFHGTGDLQTGVKVTGDPTPWSATEMQTWRRGGSRSRPTSGIKRSSRIQTGRWFLFTPCRRKN